MSGTGGSDDAVAQSYRKLAEPVYRAACARDGRQLALIIASGPGGAEHFETNTCQGCDANAIVTMWREDYDLDLTELARLLETPPHWSQSGPTYIWKNHVTGFNRGWLGVPAFWFAFYPDCRAEDGCRSLIDVADG